MTNDWLLWQLLDSAFPMGGFAHSGGLEAAWQWGQLGNADRLEGFLQASLSQVGHGALLFVMAVYRQPACFAEMDGQCQAFLSNHVANRASRIQGQSLLASAKSTFRSDDLVRLREIVLTERLPGHLAPVFGAVTRGLNLAPWQAARSFLFTTLRGSISSAVRLGAVGSLQGQAMQHRLGPYVESVVRRCIELPISDIATTAPHIDLFQGTHDRLYSRLFQS